MISINIEIYANGWKLYRYRHVYIYIHANTHGLQTSHHQDLRQFGNQEEHAFKTFTIDVASEI